MRVSELRAREAFLPLFEDCVRKAFRTLGIGTEMHWPPRKGEETWVLHPFLSACYLRGTSPVVAKFLRSTIAYTEARWRMPMQLAVALGATSELGLRLGAQACFSTPERVAGAEHILITPGNMRTRLYEFSSRRCIVVQKPGFDPRSIENEVRARREAASLTLPIESVAADLSWFEEPIFDGYALSRCPPWISRRAVERKAFAKLRSFTRKSETPIAVDLWASNRVDRIREELAAHFAEWDNVPTAARVAEELARLAAPLETVWLGSTHGDMQPGNVLIDSHGSRVVIIDWEYAGRRMSYYDPMVYYLKARRGRRLIDGVMRFVNGQLRPWALCELPRQREWRRAMSAAFLLEDFLWSIEADAAGSFQKPTREMRARLDYYRELTRLLR